MTAKVSETAPDSRSYVRFRCASAAFSNRDGRTDLEIQIAKLVAAHLNPGCRAVTEGHGDLHFETELHDGLHASFDGAMRWRHQFEVVGTNRDPLKYCRRAQETVDELGGRALVEF